MKKVLLLMFISIILLTGCNSDKKMLEELNNRREDYVNGLKKSNDNKMVYEIFNESDETCYQIYYIKDNSYTQKLVTLHNNQESFDEAVEKYGIGTYYELKKDDDKLITEIVIVKNKVIKDSDVKDYIKDKHKKSS